MGLPSRPCRHRPSELTAKWILKGDGALSLFGINPGSGAEGEPIVKLANHHFGVLATENKWSEFLAPMRHSTFLTVWADAEADSATALDALMSFLRDTPAQAAAFSPEVPFTILQFTSGTPVGNEIPESSTVAAAAFCVGLAGMSIVRRLRKRTSPV